MWSAPEYSVGHLTHSLESHLFLRLTNSTAGAGGYGKVGAVRVRKRLRAHAMDVEGGQMAIKMYHKKAFRGSEPVRTLCLLHPFCAC